MCSALSPDTSGAARSMAPADHGVTELGIGLLPLLPSNDAVLSASLKAPRTLGQLLHLKEKPDTCGDTDDAGKQQRQQHVS